MRGYCPHSVQNRYLRGQQGRHHRDVTAGTSPGAASWGPLAIGVKDRHHPIHPPTPGPQSRPCLLTSPASPSLPTSKHRSSPWGSVQSWTQSGEVLLGFSEVLAPTRSQRVPREFSPSVKGGLNPGFGLLGVAADLRVLPCCVHTLLSPPLPGAAGVSPCAHPAGDAPLWGVLCEVSHPFSGWTVMARGLSSPCEMTT